MPRRIPVWFPVLVATFLALGAAAQSSKNTPLIIDHNLADGGTVVLNMNVGDVQILPNPASAHVRLEIDPNADYDAETISGWVRRFDVVANRATLELQMPKNNHGESSPKVVLYVPTNTDLKIGLEVGDLQVQGIRGDKEMHVGVGNLTIALGDAPEYGHVEIATHIGDVHDPLNPHDQHGFLGKNEDFVLKGRFRLKATVGVGDVHLVPRSTS